MTATLAPSIRRLHERRDSIQRNDVAEETKSSLDVVRASWADHVRSAAEMAPPLTPEQGDYFRNLFTSARAVGV